MAPSLYIGARNNIQMVDGEQQQQSKQCIVLTIDGQPYKPFLSLDPANYDSIKHVVADIFQIPNYDRFHVAPVSGGNTNLLFCVSKIRCKEQTKPSIPDSVLVRVFGAPGLIDRDIETSTYAALAKQGIAPKYYGRFANGRLEEWLEGMKTLVETDMAIPDIFLEAARSFARMHSNFVIPNYLQKYHDPAKPPTLRTQLHDWLDQALYHSNFQNDKDTQRAQALELPKLTAELDWLKQSVIPKDAKVGFCHNDVLASNMLWAESTKTLHFIDFEYGGINYLSYDIANHFNEFAGGTSKEYNATPKYTDFPSPELQRTFVTEYLTTFHDGSSPSQEQVEKSLREIKGFVLANHLVWGLWGINQAATEGCSDFDYLKYGTCRIQRYYNEKNEWESKN